MSISSIALGLMVSGASAATYIWDANTGTAGAQDGAGTWTAGGLLFWDGAANVATTAADIAQFGANSALTGGVVNLATQSIDGLLFETTGTATGYTLGGTAAGQLLTVGANGILVNAGAEATSIGGANLSLALTGSQSWLNNSSNLLTINAANVTPLAGSVFTIGGSGNIAFSAATPASNSAAITKTGAGTVTWTSDPNTTGALNVENGLLHFNLTSTASTDMTTVNVNNTGILRVTGASGLTGNTVMTLAAGATYQNNLNGDTIARLLGSGTVGTTNSSGTTNVNLSSTTSAVFDGVFVDNGAGKVGFTKQNTNTVTLTGTSTATGAVLVNRGTLALDFAATAGVGSTSNILGSAVPLTINPTAGNGSATLSMIGAAGEANSQTFASTTLSANSGQSTISLTSGAGGSMSADLKAITTNNVPLNFIAPDSGTIATTNAAGLMGANVTYQTSAGAVSLAKVVGGFVTAATADFIYQTATNISAVPGYSSTGLMLLDNTSTGNVIQAAGATSLGSIEYTDSAARVLDVGAGNTLQFAASGGILSNTTAGNLTLGSAVGVGTITAGTAANSHLHLQVLNAASSMTLNSVLANNAGGAVILNKHGPGELVLAGANTYTGNTLVSAGVLEVRHANSLGTIAGTTTVLNGAALELNGGVGTTFAAEPITINGTGISNTGSLRNIIGANTVTGAITLGSSSTIAADAGTTLTMDVAAGNSITASGVSITFLVNGELLVNDPINQNATNNPTITKSGTGTLYLNSSNTMAGTGAFTISGGAVRISNGGALGGTSGSTTVGANAALELVGGISTNENVTLANTLGVTGTGALRNISGSNTMTGTVTVDDGNARITSDSGTLALNGATALRGDPSGASSRTAILGGAGNISAGGAITDGTGAGSVLTLVKDGAGTLTLSGTNTYTGTTSVSNGTLTLDYIVNNTTKLADGAALQLSGGSINLSGGSHTETVLSTSLLGGTSNVSRSSGTSVLALNTITSSQGGAINFTDNNIASTDNLNSGGVLGGWATVTIGGVTSLATNSTNTADGLITAYAPTYTDILRLGPNTVPDNAGQDVRIIDGGTSGSVNLAAALTEVNTLTMDAPAGGSTVNLTTGQVLTVGGEGGSAIFQTATSGGLTISGAGTLTTGGTANTGPATLALINDSTTNAMAISSIITNNGAADVVSLNKAGAGTLVLSGNNTFTGGITLSSGVLRAASSTGALGAGTSQLTIDGGSLQLANNTALTFARNTNVNASTTFTSDRITAGAGVTHTLGALNLNTNNSVLTFNAGSNVTSGTAGITFNGAFNTNGNAATLDIAASTTVTLSGSNSAGADAASIITKTGAGTLVISAANNFWEGPTVALTQGMLDLRSGNALGDNSPATQLITAANGTTLRLGTDTASNFNTDLTLIGTGSSMTVITDRGTAGAANTHTMDNLNMGTGNTLIVQRGSNATSGTQGLTFDAASTIGANSTIQAEANTNVTISAAVSGLGGSLNKTGTGTVTLSAANTYTGGTSVTNGTLVVSGVGTTGTGAVSVTGSGIVQGTGNITGSSVTLGTGTNLHAGLTTAVTDLATLNINSAGVMDLQSGSTISLGLNAAGSSDLLNIIGNGTGSLSLNSNFVVGPATISSGLALFQSFNLLDWSGLVSAPIFGAHFGTGLYTGAGDEPAGLDLPDITGTGLVWDLSQFTTNGTISAVPEPSRALLLLAGLVATSLRRRRAGR